MLISCKTPRTWKHTTYSGSQAINAGSLEPENASVLWTLVTKSNAFITEIARLLCELRPRHTNLYLRSTREA